MDIAMAQYIHFSNGHMIKSYWEKRRDGLLMLAIIHDDTWNVLNMQYITQIRKDVITQISLVVTRKDLRTNPHGWRWPPPLKSPQSPPTDGWRMARHRLRSAAMLKSDKPIWQNISIPWLLMPWFLLVTRTSATRLLNRNYEKSFAFHRKLFHALYHISFKQDIQRTASQDQKMWTFAERGHFK